MHRPLIPRVQRFARIRHRDDDRIFGIKQADRMSHIYIVGKTGTGKTTLIHTLLGSDIRARQGCALLDPHGDLAERVYNQANKRQKKRIVYVDPASPTCSISYNPLTRTSPALRPLVAAGLLDVFRMMWSDAWGSRMEHVLRNALLALMDQPQATLPDILLLLTSDAFREKAVVNIQNAQVKRYWRDEFPSYAKRYRGDAIAPIQSKVGALLADPRLYRFFTTGDNPLRLRSIMDGGQVLIVNLSKGRLGGDSSRLVGGVLTTMLSLAAFSRADIPEAKRQPFFIYIDEFQTFTTLAVAEMLAELRKTGVAMVMAHQFLQQIDLSVRHAVLGNAGTLISFRTGAEDAAYLSKEFEPKFSRLDLINLPNHNIYLRLMIDGAPSNPFSAVTITSDEERREHLQGMF
tara:strand:- start:15735 stop:16946 length:1212 start_codon:yes stop_codon:yes gene_type:complete